MANSRKNIQIIANDSLLDLFNDIYQESGCNSKGEFLSRLLESYTREPITSTKTIEVEKPSNPFHVTLPFTQDQKAIIKKLYDGSDLSQEIIKDIVTEACKWIKVQESGFFSKEKYVRAFFLKDVSKDEMIQAFSNELLMLGIASEE